jgi:multidrug efflux system outer membrane protein
MRSGRRSGNSTPMRRSRLIASAILLLVGSLPNYVRAQSAHEVTPATDPAMPEVKDPSLAPTARARIEIGTWDDALVHIRARSTELRIAAQEIARAEAQSRVALAGLLPSINATGALTHNNITNTTLQPVRSGERIDFRPVETPFPNFFTGQVVGSVPLLAPRAWYAIGTASQNEALAKLSLEDIKRQIALNVSSAILSVVTAERVAELNRLGLRNALTRLQLTMRRSALGIGTGLDVIRGRQDVETARATLVAGDETLRQAREALGLALGLPEQVGVVPNVDLNGLEQSARALCKPADRLEDRPDIAALTKRMHVSERQHHDAKLQFSPMLDVRSTLATTTIDTGAAPNTTWNVQAVLTVPIWDGGARYGALRDTSAQAVIAGERLEAAHRQATVQVTQAQRAVRVAEDRKQVAEQTRDLAVENDKLTRAAFQDGRGTSLELVAAAQALREAEIQLALREFELVRARVLAILALASCPW